MPHRSFPTFFGHSLFLMMVLALVTLSVPPCTAQAAQSQAGLHALLTEESPPANFMRDGELQGSSAELVSEIQRRVGDDTPIQVVPWARGIMMAERGPATALFSTTRTPQREELFKWVGPLVRVKWVLYARKGSSLQLDSLDDARRVGLIGTYIDDAREQFLIKEGFTNLDSAINNVMSVKKLMAGRIDLLIASNVGIGKSARDAGFSRDDLVEKLVVKQADLYIAFSPDTPDPLVARWQQALDAMAADGTYAEIYERWYPGEPIPLQVVQ